MNISDQPGTLFDAAAACSCAIMSAEKKTDKGSASPHPAGLPAGLDEKNAEQAAALLDEIGKQTFSSAVLPFFRRSGGGFSPAETYILSLPADAEEEAVLGRLRTDPAERARLRSCLTEAMFGLSKVFQSGSPLRAGWSDPSSDGISGEEAALLSEAALPVKVRLDAALCLARFSDAVDDFCGVIEHTLPLIRRLRGLYHLILRDTAEAAMSGQYDELYRETAGFRPEKIRFVSASLLSPALCETAGTGDVLLCGTAHAEILLERFENAHISTERFFDDIGSGPRRRILEILGRGGERTASALSRETGLPVTTTLRHLEVLSNDLLIRESRRSGLKIYYTLNTRYFARAAEKAERYLSSLTREA